ncbi:MAG: hypothetical protein K6G40_01940 [Eubacterium sp.]|nr:hypothetical protein [Eubacterium sp.]
MLAILEVREKIRSFVGTYDKFIRIILKFLLTFISLYMIVSFLGQDISGKLMLVFVALGIICSALPGAVGPTVCSLGALIVVFIREPYLAGILGGLLLIMVLVYFAYIPDNAVVMLITIIAAIVGLPYITPVCAGMFKKPHSSIAVGFGMVTYYILIAIKSILVSIEALGETDDTSVIEMFVTQLKQNKEIIFATILAMLVVIIVYAIRSIAIDYAWQMAAGIGILLTLLAYLIADFSLELYKNMAAIFGGCILSAVIVFLIGFICYHMDYTRTEYVQFEDEEYKYYVKAVPKVSVKAMEKTVRNINEEE